MTMVAIMRSAWCDIDLNALESNARILASIAGVPLLPIVKANAYGHGVEAVADRLATIDQVWGVGVVLVTEARHLREHGYRGTILIPGGLLPEQAEEALECDAVIALSDMGVARALAAEARRRGTKQRVHIKVDVGMHRLGFPLGDAESVAGDIAALDGLSLEGVVTHLAAAHAGDEQSLTRTRSEIAVFARLVSHLRQSYGPLIAHAANSSALLSLKEAAFDLVRPGLTLYGWTPSEWLGSDVGLQPAMAVRARVAVVKMTSADALVGYSQTPVGEGQRIGIIPIGYADGIPNRWGVEGGYVLFLSGKAPLLGSVSMDSCVVDLTDLPGEGIGSTALLLGAGPEGTIEPAEIGKATGREQYELLVGLNGRLPRRYH
ncbi:alanine racemase [Candidatus Zixiibacteriota bacterium]